MRTHKLELNLIRTTKISGRLVAIPVIVTKIYLDLFQISDMKSTILLLLGSFLLSGTTCENVLVLCPMCSRSHKNIMEATVEGLAKRGHSITIVSSFKTPIDSHNIRDIIVMKGFDYFNNINALETRKLGMLGLMRDDMTQTTIDGCHTTYKNPEFMKLLNETFDLVFIDAFSNQCLQGFVYRLNAPVIRSVPLPVPRPLAMQIGNYLPPSFVPDPLLPFGEEMTLLQRIINISVSKIFWMYYFSWYPVYEKLYRGYLGDDIPGLMELESNFSMYLVNSHFSINRPKPAMPDVVEIGGVHCRPGKPLPKDLEKFVSGSEDGVILFSLGSIFKGKDMPESTRKAFLNAFSKLKQRVLWKWDFNDMDDLPSNVKLSKWLPVQDILAHPNTKVFITHGGLLSTQEAIYHGVPLVGVPLFGDQDLNVKRYVDVGIATSIEILGLKEEVVLNAINTVLDDPKYRNNVKEMSTLFRDQPMSAIGTAVFWSEYVMRHKGAPQLRSIARKLSYIQFHSLDVIAILSLTILISLILPVLIIRKIYRKCFAKALAVAVTTANGKKKKQ